MSDNPVRDQYERFPYPPLPTLALPRRDQGASLRYERGLELAGEHGDHRSLRLLVAGCGTLEGLVAAQVHPRAAQVVAVDLSGAAIAQLRRRARLRRSVDTLTLRPLIGRGLPPLRCERADLATWEGGEFDYVIASNLLHHHPDPAHLLARLAAMLRPGGLMRLRTYSAHSRLWVRETGRWLRASGVGPATPRLVTRAHEVLARLPPLHPLRAAFRAYEEDDTTTGLVDAYFHACENPLPPLAWRAAADAAGLQLVGEDHAPGCRSDALAELLPATAVLDPWERLQVLDDLLELTSNPILWLRKGEPRPPRPLPAEGTALTTGDGDILSVETALDTPRAGLRLPSRVRFEMGAGLRRAEALLTLADVPLAAALGALRTQWGPHHDRHGRPLPGLSVTEYDTAALMALPEPWDDARWQALEGRLGSHAALRLAGALLPGEGLAAQARYLQARFGAEADLLGPLTVSA